MKKIFLNTCISFLKKYHEYTPKDIKKLEYGLEGLYLTLTKLIIILFCSLILGIFKEVVLVLLFFNIIRYTGFGFHAEKSSECLLCSLINFLLIPLFFLKVRLPMAYIIGICILCLISYLLFAPADTVKRPLPNKKKRMIRKVFTLIIGTLYITAIIIFNNPYITALLISSLIVESIMISPITYKIFRQPYNNYKSAIRA